MTGRSTTICWGVGILATLLLPESAATVAARGQDVPAPATPPAARYSVAWRTPAPAGGPITLTLTSTAVILSGEDVPTTAHARDDGRVLWTNSMMTAMAPAATDSLLLVASPGALRALDAATGRERWTANIGGPTTRPFPIRESVLIAGGTDLIAFRLADGRELWRRPLGSTPVTAIVQDGTSLFVGLADHALVSLDAAAGTIRWRIQLDYAPLALTASHERIYFGNTARYACAYEQRDGSLDWCFAVRAPIIGAPVVDDRFVYFVLLDNTVRVLDRRHGAMARRDTVTARPIGGPQPLPAGFAIPLITGAFMELSFSAGPSALLAAASPDETLQAAAVATDAELIAIVTVSVAGTRQLTVFRRTADTATGTP